MKQSMQLNLTHHLTLTPQLQQAIRLLQLSTLDLKNEIQNQIESNPMLEEAPNEEIYEPSFETLETGDESSEFNWSDLYLSKNQTRHFNESDYIYENVHCTVTNLQDYLRWQLDLTPMSDIDRVIAIAIIDAIDDDGFLTLPISDLQLSLTSPTYPINIAEIKAVKNRIQHFDPIGCGANNLVETLLIQLEQLSPTTPHVELAKQIIIENMALLGQHNYRQLMKIYRVNENALNQALHIIQRLNPKPGSIIPSAPPEYIIPDLIVKKNGANWQINLNQDILPRLSINRQYASFIKRATNTADNQFLKINLQEARWFLKSIQSRQETLLKVARYIIRYQQDFLEFGDEAMKPLVLNEVALALNLHESTVSRVTTQKFICTPRGLYELKYFFSNHLSTQTGGDFSSTAIRAVIKKLIAAEDRAKPLSDSALAKLIGQQGIQIARRTVAKYREEMGITSSTERKLIRS